MKKNLNKILKERAELINDAIPLLFECGRQPSNNILKYMLIQKAIPKKLEYFINRSVIKVNVKEIINKYTQGFEMVDTKTDGILICPLSQGIIERKWEGMCGHLFEWSVVLNYLENHEMCPVIGCKKRLIEKVIE